MTRLNRPKAIYVVTLEMFRDVDKALESSRLISMVAVILLEGVGERGLCARRRHPCFLGVVDIQGR